MKFITANLVPLLLVASALPSAAAVVYSQDVQTAPSGTVYASQNEAGGLGSFAKVYDNFSLKSTTNITDVHWYGGFFNPTTPPGTITSFLIQIWADVAGAPGAELYSASINGSAGQTLSGLSNVNGALYAYNVDLVAAFVAQENTTYWLSIQPTMDFPPQWGWATGTGGDGTSYQDFGGRSTLGTDMAFSLTSTPNDVPEPGSLMLAGLALLGLSAARTKRVA